MYPLPLEAFACLEVWPLGHARSVLLSVVAQALPCNFLCVGSSSSLFFGKAADGCQWKSRLLNAGFRTGARHRCRVLKEVFTSRARWMCLIIEWNASTNMFYLLKNLLLLILVIFKLKHNNLLFNEIMIWMLRMCVCMHSCFIENHAIWILEDAPLISEVVLSQRKTEWTGLPSSC
jgi:hypothetical protein